MARLREHLETECAVRARVLVVVAEAVHAAKRERDQLPLPQRDDDERKTHFLYRLPQLVT